VMRDISLDMAAQLRPAAVPGTEGRAGAVVVLFGARQTERPDARNSLAST